MPAAQPNPTSTTPLRAAHRPPRLNPPDPPQPAPLYPVHSVMGSHCRMERLQCRQLRLSCLTEPTTARYASPTHWPRPSPLSRLALLPPLSTPQPIKPCPTVCARPVPLAPCLTPAPLPPYPTPPLPDPTTTPTPPLPGFGQDRRSTCGWFDRGVARSSTLSDAAARSAAGFTSHSGSLKQERRRIQWFSRAQAPTADCRLRVVDGSPRIVSVSVRVCEVNTCVGLAAGFGVCVCVCVCACVCVLANGSE